MVLVVQQHVGIFHLDGFDAQRVAVAEAEVAHGRSKVVVICCDEICTVAAASTVGLAIYTGLLAAGLIYCCNQISTACRIELKAISSRLISSGRSQTTLATSSRARAFALTGRAMK